MKTTKKSATKPAAHNKQLIKAALRVFGSKALDLPVVEEYDVVFAQLGRGSNPSYVDDLIGRLTDGQKSVKNFVWAGLPDYCSSPVVDGSFYGDLASRLHLHVTEHGYDKAVLLLLCDTFEDVKREVGSILDLQKHCMRYDIDLMIVVEDELRTSSRNLDIYLDPRPYEWQKMSFRQFVRHKVILISSYVPLIHNLERIDFGQTISVYQLDWNDPDSKTSEAMQLELLLDRAYRDYFQGMEDMNCVVITPTPNRSVQERLLRWGKVYDVMFAPENPNDLNQPAHFESFLSGVRRVAGRTSPRSVVAEVAFQSVPRVLVHAVRSLYDRQRRIEKVTR